MDKLFHYEIHHIPAKFRPGEVVGAGSFGRVVLLEDPAHPERKDFVIKEILLEESKQNADRLRVEVAILSALHHQHIVQFYGCKFENKSVLIFLPYMQKGSLKDYIEEKKKEIEEKCVEHMDATTGEPKKKLAKNCTVKFVEENGVLSEETTSLFTYQILKGLIYLHDNLIIHRDIKGANILLDQDLKIKLADFGISKILRNQTTNTSEMGTVKWMAPEIINEKPYDFKVDIWSVGATVVEMVTGSPPFPDQQPTRVIIHMFCDIPRHKHTTMEAELEYYEQGKAFNRTEEEVEASVKSKLGNRIVRNVKNKSGVSDRISETESTANR
ncbi:mitogen-activated protein kinase kinase kinase 3-like [Physella acuta]|uniref:mitogen-activated protein kinase kinase kinase 3-like n=1 Tax=Physella acuta TaxID=109671 RepID=UPI0027DE9868|nr:mitogen-activated protein kinase kinase kinase 3-like [Physella acuta]